MYVVLDIECMLCLILPYLVFDFNVCCAGY